MEAALERITTGVPGLDVVLGGGFTRGGVHMVMGRPGSGKTVLGNQLCFHHIAHGERALFVTLLSESHGRLLALLRGLSFFDASKVGHALAYVSAYNDLERGRLDGLLELIRHTIRQHSASLLVIDGFPTAVDLAPSEVMLKRFLHELQVLVELLGCTCVLLTGSDDLDAHHPERIMVDGLLQLGVTTRAQRAVRELEVIKHRGSALLDGCHVYRIDDNGLSVFPRAESVVGRGSRRHTPATTTRRPFGLPGLDDLLQGGLSAGATTLLCGPPGAGKTDFGLSFLVEGVAAGERGLYLGFHEDPTASPEVALRRSARQAVEAGGLDLIVETPAEHLADRLAHELLRTVEAGGVTRVVIDETTDLLRGLLHPERGRPFLAALAAELRGRGATCLLLGRAIEAGAPDPFAIDLAGLADEVIALEADSADPPWSLRVLKGPRPRAGGLQCAYQSTRDGLRVTTTSRARCARARRGGAASEHGEPPRDSQGHRGQRRGERRRRGKATGDDDPPRR